MLQPDLFTSLAASPDGTEPIGSLLVEATNRNLAADAELRLPDIMDRIAQISTRPRYTLMVLNLIITAAGTSGRAGPYVTEHGKAVPIRDWLSDALMPMARRDPRRRQIVTAVCRDLRRQMAVSGDLPLPNEIIDDAVRARVRRSGRSNVSRAVSDLVRAGLLRRHYQGYRVDHHNRGAQREAVYEIMPAIRRAFDRN